MCWVCELLSSGVFFRNNRIANHNRRVRCVRYSVGLLRSSLVSFTHDLIKVNSRQSCVTAPRSGMTLLKSEAADLAAYVLSDGCRDLMNWGWRFLRSAKQMWTTNACRITYYLCTQSSRFKHHFEILFK